MAYRHQVDCEVVVSPDLVFGVFANAFRIVEQDSGHCRLEFLVFSDAEQRAKVVAPVSIRKSFLPVIRDILTRSLHHVENVGRAEEPHL